MDLRKTVIFVVGILITVCSGLPTNKKDEVEDVTPVRTYGDQPIVDTGLFGSWDNPFSSNPFGGLFSNLEGIMERMRQQIASLLNRYPISNGGNSTEDLSPFPSLLHPSIPGFEGIDLTKGNTTSVIKVIDGHKVIINETEYKNENDFGGTFFKVRVIDIKDSSELTTEKESEAASESSTVPKDREELANSIENEIVKSKEVHVLEHQDKVSLYDNLEQSTNTFDQIETFDELASSPRLNAKNKEAYGWGDVEAIETFGTNELDSGESRRNNFIPIDLSRDTYVNELVGAPNNPDAEEFEVKSIRDPRRFEKITQQR